MTSPCPPSQPRRGTAWQTPVLIEVNHGNGRQGRRGDDRRSHPVDQPLGSLTTTPGIGLAQPVLVPDQPDPGERQLRPAHGGTGPNVDHQGRHVPGTPPPPSRTSSPTSENARGQEPRVHDVDEPVPAVTSRGAGSLVSPALIEPILKQLNDAQVDPRRIIFVDGHPYLLDIRFRMLQNPELARAMGFDDEETKYEFVGNVSEVTKQIGNAVPVHLAAALVAAILDPGMDS